MGLGTRATPPPLGSQAPQRVRPAPPDVVGSGTAQLGHMGTVAVSDLKAILQAPGPLSSPPRLERALASSPEGTAEGQCPHRKMFPQPGAALASWGLWTKDLRL